MPIFGNFGHSQLLSSLWVKTGFTANTLTAGNTLWTASASPQPAAGIDSWDGGKVMFRNLLIVVDVASISAGTLTISLYDDNAALTTGNVAANANLVASFTAISAAGLYTAELMIGEHNFASTLTRVVASSDAAVVQRYHTLKAVAAGGDSVFSALMIYGMNKRDFPVQDATALTVTWAST